MPDTTPTTELRAQIGQALRRWGLFDEVNDPAATEEFAVTDLMAVLREPLARQVLGTTDQQPETARFCGRSDCLALGHRFMLGSTVYTCTGKPETAPTDRRVRYAIALRDTAHQWQHTPPRYGYAADAVMAVADAELREARAQADVLSAELTRRAPMTGEYANEIIRLRAEVERLRTDRAAEGRRTLAAALDGLHTLIATSSRDWQTYRVDAWIWAVLCGWDCNQDTHDETCTHGALEETAAMHGWDDATVAKARCYRAAVRRLADEAQQGSPEPEPGCAHCGGPHAWDDCETYTQLVADEA